MKFWNRIYSGFSLDFFKNRRHTMPVQSTKGDAMSNYSTSMVTALQSQSWDYESASAFAAEHNLSVRSVISKIKNLDLDYTPKPKTVSTAGPRVVKADIVDAITKALDADPDSLAGLAKADARALNALLMAIS
jgi:hypothetical protein